MGEPNDMLAQSNFEKSLTQLNQRVGWVPTGWQSLYVDSRRRLIAIQCVQRAHVLIEDPWLGMNALYLEAKGADKVVDGILRKVMRCSRHICSDCGRTGAPWDIEDREYVLCPHCAGLRVLRSDLLDFSAYIQRHMSHAIGGWLRLAHLSPRIVVLLEVAQPDAIERRGEQTWHVNLHATQRVVDKAIASLDRRLD